MSKDRQAKRRALAQCGRNSKSARIESSANGASTYRHIDGDIDIITTQNIYKEPLEPTLPLLSPIPISAARRTDVEEETDPIQDGQEKDTQTRAVINDFVAIESHLQSILLERYANPTADTLCACGDGFRRVRCRWDGCFQYPASCERCFVRAHKMNPLHWALLWDSEKEIWCRKDYSELLPGNFIQLGHVGEGKDCPRSGGLLPIQITHTNGVHSTKVQFCGCNGKVNRVDQLLRADLFPATATDPRSAFTLAILRHFRMHNLQSKCGAFDFIMSIRRLTDNTFTRGVPNPYKSFLRISRIWDLLCIKRWSGVALGIKAFLPTRIIGALNVFCPSCPEPGVNMPLEVSPRPSDMRHTASLRLTIDGNHHANRYAKNTDHNDASLLEGEAYMPTRDEYKEHLSMIPVTKEKSRCSFINAVNFQDRKKFRANDETGLINFQCNHVIISASADMYLGERHAYVDYGIGRTYRMRKLAGIDIYISYDSTCSLRVNIVKRFEENQPDLADLVARTTFSIDALHINDHIDKCMYLYSASYQECTGHFHGVGTEQYWAENNQMGPQTRQMNPGHRHDKIISHHADWNWKKIGKFAITLSKDLTTACALYVKNRDDLRKLTELHRESVPQWFLMDKKPALVDGEVRSVYRHSVSKVLSLDTIDENLSKLIESPKNMLKAQSAYFLKEGMSIQAKQLKLRTLIKHHKDHPLLASQRDIELTRSDISLRLERWRSLQATYMASAYSSIVSECSVPIENEVLYFPSHFSITERIDLCLLDLEKEELELRQAQVVECIMQLRCSAKKLSSARAQKKKDGRGQFEGGRSTTIRQSLEFNQECLLLIYNMGRQALVSLSDDSHIGEAFPHLSSDDLYRKPTTDKRQQGDSRRSDGKLWGVGARASVGSASSAPASTSPVIVPTTSDQTEDALVRSFDRSLGEQSTGQLGEDGSEGNGDARKDGKLWSPVIGLSIAEAEEWDREEDRVQWFRTWANMQRWLEELEIKHIDFMRAIKSFSTMQTIWKSMASAATDAGPAGFARRQSSLYADLRKDMEKWFEETAEPRFLHITEENVVETIQNFRREELGWLLRYDHPPARDQ